MTKINSRFLWIFFEKSHIPYNLRRRPYYTFRLLNLLLIPVNSLVFRWSLLLNNLLSQVQENRTLEEFQNRIKNYIHC